MKRLTLLFGLFALVALTSCATITNAPEKVDLRNGPISPISALYIVLDSLDRGDIETAKKCTLYGEYVDWNQVLSSYKAQPKRFRISKILYSDPNPEQFNSSVVYYKSQSGKNSIVYFTKVNGRWYWGNEIQTPRGAIVAPERGSE